MESGHGVANGRLGPRTACQGLFRVGGALGRCRHAAEGDAGFCDVPPSSRIEKAAQTAEMS